MTDDITLGELARRMDALHADIRELRSSIVEHDDLANANTAWQTALTAQDTKHQLMAAQMKKDIEALQSWQVWAARLVIGAVILAILGIVLSSSGAL